MTDILQLAKDVLAKAADKIEYKIANDKDGRVWLCIDNSGHDIEIGDMETADACCYAAYGKLFGFANAAPELAQAVVEMQAENERVAPYGKMFLNMLKVEEQLRAQLLDHIRANKELADIIAEAELARLDTQAEIARLRGLLEQTGLHVDED